MTPSLLLPASDPRLSALLTDLDPRFRAELVADIPPQLAKDHFVAAAFHRGVRMMLYKILAAGAGLAATASRRTSRSLPQQAGPCIKRVGLERALEGDRHRKRRDRDDGVV